KLNIDVKAKVIKVEYDALKNKYEKLELGNFKKNLSDQTGIIKKYIDDSTSEIKESIGNLNDVISDSFADDKLTNIEANNLKISFLMVKENTQNVINVADKLGLTYTEERINCNRA